MTRFGTGYTDRENKDQDRWNRGISRTTSSLSFSNKPRRQIYDALLTRSRGNHLPMVEASRRG
jgi:hypothetical protein